MLPPDAPPSTSPAGAPSDPGAGPVLVNKKELAGIIGCSLPTLAAWIDRFGVAFPVEQRGTNGREWLFDPAKVVAFLRAERDREAEDAAERARQLEQFALPGLGAADPAAPVGTTPAELLALARVRQIQRKEQMEAGFLVPTSDVRTAIAAAVTRWNRAQASILTQLARKHGWPDALLRDAQTLFAEAQRAFVHDGGNFAPASPVDLFAEFSPDAPAEPSAAGAT